MQRISRGKVDGAFEEVKTNMAAEEKAREGTGATPGNGPLETPNEGNGRLCRS